MLVSLSGERFSYKAGDSAEFEDEEAQRYVDKQIAKYEEEEPKPIKKTTKKAESAE